ncbi:MAG: LacI family DNA-binding transcriptional regulator [Chloroflexi bacterium]|nr:LacI family DNA-binding transcriptional regulator [Chloroflexota bacterium]
MPVTIVDVARKAGVSTATVSRVLHKSPKVDATTRARVRETLEELGYSPNIPARSLVTKRTRTVGLVITTIADPFFADIVRGVEDVAIENDYGVILCDSNADPEREMATIRLFQEKRVDGIIVASSRVGDLYLGLLEKTKVPVVLVNNEKTGAYVYSVGTDDVAGGEMATEYLIQLGHRRIGYIAGLADAKSTYDRLTGYRQALRKHGLPFDSSLLAPGNARPDGGLSGMNQLLTDCPSLTAVFCYNDLTAIGALKALRIAGKGVPDLVSVMGYDDLLFAAYSEPPLTTIEQRKYDLGAIAMRMLLDLQSGVESVSNNVLEPRLVIRESCSPAKS